MCKKTFVLVFSILILICLLPNLIFAEERSHLYPFDPEVPLKIVFDKEYALGQNLLKNASFEIYKEAPQELVSWIIDNPEAILSQEPTDKLLDAYSLSIQSEEPVTLAQDIPHLAYFQGKKLAFGCWVKAQDPESVRLSINDGQDTYSDYHSGDNSWQFLSVKRTVDELAQQLKVIIENNSTNTVYLDATCLYELTKDIAYSANPSDNIKMPADLIYTDLENKRVGINTNLPQETLEVQGNIKATGGILSGDNLALTEISADELYINDQPLTGEETLSGNLNITGNLIVDTYLQTNGSIQAEKFLFSDGSELKNLWSETDAKDGIYYNKGNVGIGKMDPSYPLEIWYGGSSGIGFNPGDSASVIGTTTNHDLRIATSGLENQWLTVTNSGNVGIGTTGPSTKLHIVNGEATGAEASYAPYDVLTIDDDSAAYINLRSPSTGTHSLSAILFSDDVRAQGEIEYQHIYNSSVIDKMFFSTNATKRMTIDGAGNVGIGKTDPSYKLDVAGTINATEFLKGGSALGQWGISGSNIYYNTGNVGIGTTSPHRKLTIVGTLSSAYSTIDDSDIGLGAFDTYNLLFSSYGTTGSYKPLYVATGGQNRMAILTDGNVGIGTTGPLYKLDVVGSGTTTSALARIANNTKTISLHLGGGSVSSLGADEYATALRFNGLDVAWGDISYYPNGGDAGEQGHFRFSLAGSAVVTTPNAKVGVGSLYSAGNVGIGTTSPQANLDVNGNIRISGADDRRIFFTPGVVGVTQMSMAAVSGGHIDIKNNLGATMHRFDQGGNVGIGTTSPETKLNIFGAQAEGLRIQSSGSGTPTNYLSFWNSDSVMGYIGYGSNEGTLYVTNELADKNIYLVTKGAGDIIVSNGDIRINNGNINAKYQDVAEWVESEQELTPGTVVIIDTNSVNKVIASNSAYDAKVCGVVSYQPGLSLGEKGENKYQIAHTGRVKVKVDASFGKILQGDLLVTSSKKGFAMRYSSKNYKPGVILGKALESLDEGEGEILVLLSLQ